MKMTEVRFLPPAARYLKKLKDRQLKDLYRKAVDLICEDYTVGRPKTGDLAGIYGYDIFYNKTNYELAYTVEFTDDTIIVIIMAGTSENFYEQVTYSHHFPLCSEVGASCSTALSG
jgi:mRNA-degrading endonuclease RelE of RelBE toxin-antitoxin system